MGFVFVLSWQLLWTLALPQPSLSICQTKDPKFLQEVSRPFLVGVPPPYVSKAFFSRLRYLVTLSKCPFFCWSKAGGSISNVLLSVDVPVVSDSECNSLYSTALNKNPIYPSMLCAGDTTSGKPTNSIQFILTRQHFSFKLGFYFQSRWCRFLPGWFRWTTFHWHRCRRRSGRCRLLGTRMCSGFISW